MAQVYHACLKCVKKHGLIVIDWGKYPHSCEYCNGNPNPNEIYQSLAVVEPEQDELQSIEYLPE